MKDTPANSRGVIMFAHNNEEIDYFKIACINALMVRKNLKTEHVSIVTDEHTLSWGIQSLGIEFINKCFEHVIVQDRDYVYQTKNIRLYKDTVYSTKQLPFYNCDHWLAYDLSPYDETLFIDADYLIMSDVLNNVWGSNHNVMINSNVKEVMFSRKEIENTVDEFGIKLYWATAIYFKKSSEAEQLFKIVKHVFDNYKYYRQLYSLPRNLFRNDFAFSIAVHMLNGFTNLSSIPELPIPAMYKSFDTDDIAQVKGVNDVILCLEKPGQSGEFYLTRFTGLDLHIMNKYAIGRHADKFIELYS